MSIRHVGVDRDQDGFLKISWVSDHQDRTVSIYSGNTPDDIDYLNPIAKLKGKNEFACKDRAFDFRRYFSIISENGQRIISAERLVHLEGTLNFRDLGGYKTDTGKHVKWGKIFRSDSLSKLTQKDHFILNQMGLKTVFDFRGKAEMERSPDRLPRDGSIVFFHLPVSSHSFDTLSALERLKKGDTGWLTESFMRDGYITNIDQYAQTWGMVMNCLSIAENRPLVFHCTAGKDRTGTFAALLLLLLGVPEETIIHDHGISNFFLADFLEKLFAYFKTYGVEREKINPYLTAPKDAIIALLDHIRKKYGSAEEYFLRKAGLKSDTIQVLRKDLLE
ncbi:MAG: tyrosine-protein phosphatase [Desulfobacteraceae bacterium]|nr:MAG: tyrosine-protein phosphatase [Desulfobacteraceae bacterium]